MKTWTVQVRDQTVHFVQFDLNLHCPQKLLVLSSVGKKLTVINDRAAESAGRDQTARFYEHERLHKMLSRNRSMGIRTRAEKNPDYGGTIDKYLDH